MAVALFRYVCNVYNIARERERKHQGRLQPFAKNVLAGLSVCGSAVHS